MAEETVKPEEKKDETKKLIEEPAVTRDAKVGKLEYTVETGRLPILDQDGEVDALISYHYYKKKGNEDRPLILSFNGGPGSPSLWLHLGTMGPRRVKMEADGNMPQPPYQLVDNPHNWLEFGDLVFIDPVGTGFSRAKDEKTSEKYWSLKGDIESVGEFIRLFLVRKERWRSPLYLAGESYGTTRATGLSGYLIERGITFSGLILVSSVLSFQTLRFNKGNDLPYAVYLPTYSATAHYHGKVTGDLQKIIDKARKFAFGDYWLALAKGSGLVGTERENIRAELSALTGLSEDYLERCDLRPDIWKFCKELCRDEGRTVGRLDSRFKGIDATNRGVDEGPEHDPSMSLLMGPYTTLYNYYVRSECGFETDLEYMVFKGIKKPWEWGSAGEGHPDTSEALRKAMSRNPYMGVFVASGYYDLATPFFATEYTVSHLDLDESLRGNIEIQEYEAGHMMYIHEGSLKKLAGDVQGFVERTKGF